MKSGAISAIVVVVLIVLAIVYWLEININPNITIPPAPTQPAHNAFDYIVAASGFESRSDDVDDAISTKPDKVWTLKEKKELLAANAPALAKLHQGLALPYSAPSIQSQAASDSYLPRIRAMCRLLRLASQVKRADGDWAGALQCDMEAIQVGETIPRGGTLLSRLVGDACQAIGRKDVWQEIEHLPGPAAREAAVAIESWKASQYTLSDSITQEKWMGELSLLETFHQRGWNGTVVGLGMWTNPDRGPNIGNGLKSLLTSKRAVVKNYARYMDELTDRAKMPYPDYVKAGNPPLPRDPINSMFFLDIDKVKDADNDTQNDLLAVALALHAFKAERGAYPVALAQLAPAYLPAVPQDLFAKSGPLRYRRAGASYVLYSVGPDGVDDGGRAIAGSGTSTSPPSLEYSADENSKGDIVAGVNTY